jgi:FAD-dependent urate hydroxylase
MTSQTRTALIIGGGIAGPVTAMALRRAGIEATVYEGYPPADGSAGGGMSLAPNGLEALDVLGLGDLIRPVGRPMTGIVMQDWAGRRLGEFGNPAGVAPMQFVWRGELQQALSAEAARRGIRIEHGKRLVGASETASGVNAQFADGTTAGADILIGADGIRSTVRPLIDPQAPGPRYAGLISFGARVNDTGLPATLGKMNMSFGKRGFFGYQIFDDATAVWFVNLPQREPITAAQTQQTPPAEWIATLSAKFAEDRTPARSLIAQTDPGELLIVGPMENLPTIPRWSRGRLVLVGDAVHAPSSSSGQGASLAIESAVQLARCLRDLPYDQAFAGYQALRRPRVEKIIAATTRKNSDKTAGPVGRVVNGLLMRVFAKLVNPEKMAWMFDYPIDWDVPVGPVGQPAVVGQ